MVKTEAMKKALREIVSLLLPHFPGDSAQELDEETAKERRKEKEKRLRSRISDKKAEEERLKLRENQELVDSFYVPLMPELFSGNFSSEDFHPEFQKAFETADFSSVGLLLIPLFSFLFSLSLFPPLLPIPHQCPR